MNEENELFEKIRQLIAEQLNIDVARVMRESTLDSLGADSIDRVELVIRLEEVFDIEIKDEDAEKILTVGHVVDYLKAHKK